MMRLVSITGRPRGSCGGSAGRRRSTSPGGTARRRRCRARRPPRSASRVRRRRRRSRRSPGAAYECVKYTCAPGARPASRRDAPGAASSAFQPTCGIFSRCAGVAAQPRDAARQHAEAGHLRRLVAALEQPLHAEADAEQRRARVDGRGDRVAPRSRRARRWRRSCRRRHDERRPRRRSPPGDAGVAKSAPSAVSALRTDVRLPAP